MSRNVKHLALSTAVLFSAGMLYAAPAQAQATRTWVSGVGDDVNPCSRTAPCKTFAGAISKTAASGEINCIDPGGFGALTITKAITIDCSDVLAGVLVANTNAIIVNAASTDVIVLRGLDINGLGNAYSSPNGVRVVNAKTVIVEDSTIYGFQHGVSVDNNFASGNIQLIVNNTSFRNNAVSVNIVPTTGTTVNFTLDDVKIQSATSVPAIAGTGSGVFISTQGATPVVTGRIYRSEISGGVDANAIGVNAKVPTGTVTLTIDSSAILDNANTGLKVTGGTTRVADTVITGNGIGVAGSTIVSFGNNRLAGNGTDGSFTSTIPTN